MNMLKELKQKVERAIAFGVDGFGLLVKLHSSFHKLGDPHRDCSKHYIPCHGYLQKGTSNIGKLPFHA